YPTAVPYLEFHRAFQIYRSTLNHKIRKEVAHEICLVFLKSGSKLVLKGAPSTNAEMLHQMNNMDALKKEYPLDLFDSLHYWVARQIAKYWTDFMNATLKTLVKNHPKETSSNQKSRDKDNTTIRLNGTKLKDIEAEVKEDASE
ncbi:hypothetical protein RFI_26035, partial [Reticulomyxa filosa]